MAINNTPLANFTGMFSSVLDIPTRQTIHIIGSITCTTTTNTINMFEALKADRPDWNNQEVEWRLLRDLRGINRPSVVKKKVRAQLAS